MSLPRAAHSALFDNADFTADPDRQQFAALLDEIDDLLRRMSDAEQLWSSWLAGVAPEHRPSARNMLHYWAIRQLDLRDVQCRLAGYGLSSLGRSEPHVQATLLAIRTALRAITEGGWQESEQPAVSLDQGSELLHQRTEDLLGPAPAYGPTRIMVTLPSAAATDPDLVADLVRHGMDIARINCAHDDADTWREMARKVRKAAEAAGRSCLIAMDLAGPKLRTAPLEPGPQVVKIRPRRDKLGHVVAPARAWLTAADHPTDPPQPGMTALPVPGPWLSRRHAGDVLQLRDSRGARRQLTLASHDGAGAPSAGFVVTSDKTTYLVAGSRLHPDGIDDPAEIGPLQPTEQRIVLRAGDVLHLARDSSRARVGDATEAPRIGCTLPELFDHAHVGDGIHFDDGKISGRVISATSEELAVRIEQPTLRESKLAGGKGINVPDTVLPISAVTDKDIADLASVVELADFVQVSFVRNSSDVQRLFDELDRLGADDLGVVLKIETLQSFQHLPQLVLTAMKRSRIGVMIARGDLAVEAGYERLAELQEEILWLCEAAHLPVIWATQVLEQLAKRGHPSRAEISDAAMSGRAECVMLNKGPYITAAVVAVENILQRMARHHYKKNALLRTLHSWHPDDSSAASQHLSARNQSPSA